MNKLMSVLLVVAFLGFVGINSIFVINEGQQAIITQFGKPVRSRIDSAGLYFKLPFLQVVHYFDKRILKWDGDANEIPTNDKMFIWVDTTARWRIADPLLFLQRVNNMNRATLVLNDLINGAVRDLVTKNELVEVIRSSDWDPSFFVTDEQTKRKEEIRIGRDRMTRLVYDRVAPTLQSYGVELLDVLVKRINYTNQVREKVYARMISERQRIAEQKRSEGQARKAEILGDMERQLKQITSEAYRKSEEIKGKADAEVTALYGKAYNKDPEFYRFYTTLESYGKVLGNNTRLVIDANSPLYQYLNQLKPSR